MHAGADRRKYFKLARLVQLKPAHVSLCSLFDSAARPLCNSNATASTCAMHMHESVSHAHAVTITRCSLRYISVSAGPACKMHARALKKKKRKKHEEEKSPTRKKDDAIPILHICKYTSRFLFNHARAKITALKINEPSRFYTSAFIRRIIR